MTVTYETLAFDVTDEIARVALNRPDAANAFNPALCRDLFDAAIACDERDDIRAVVLTGEGSMFSAGGDLKYFDSQGDKLGAALKEITGLLHAEDGTPSAGGFPFDQIQQRAQWLADTAGARDADIKRSSPAQPNAPDAAAPDDTTPLARNNLDAAQNTNAPLLLVARLLV